MRETAVLAQENATVLRHGLAVLDELDDDAYRGGEQPPADGVGPQFRHLIEFYRCLLDGYAGGRVDYTLRSREARLERERTAAAGAIRSLIDRLDELGRTAGDGEVQVRVERPRARDSEPLWSRSSLARELQFLQSHTIHHYALIRRELRARGVPLDRGFGMAPSTLDHQEEIPSLAD